MLDRLRRNLAWRSELKALAEQIEREPRPTLAAPVERSPGQFLWCLPLPAGGNAYMALTAGRADHDLFVVPVHAAAFHRAWLVRGLQSDDKLNDLTDGCRLRGELTTDRKFKHAAACFAEGERNPVDLPRVGTTKARKGELGVTFTDGITRTFWLLANNVAAFPVVVAGPETAAELAKAVGLGAPQRVSALFAAAEKARSGPQEAQRVAGAVEGRGEQEARPAQRLARPRRPRGQGVDL